jgi:CDK-activating kinase assembly factor MAT1
MRCRFNKRLDDFDGDLRAYNDYLEEIEDIGMSFYLYQLDTITIVFHLVNDHDVQSMNERIERYRAENQASIKRNLELQVRFMRIFLQY